jgi:hypothetical protein
VFKHAGSFWISESSVLFQAAYGADQDERPLNIGDHARIADAQHQSV